MTIKRKGFPLAVVIVAGLTSISPWLQVNAAEADKQTGEPVTVAAGCTVSDLVDQLGLGDRKIAVAVNRSVVPRSRYLSHSIESADRVEILEAVGGG